MAAGGWRDITALQKAYQAADPETVRRVVELGYDWRGLRDVESAASRLPLTDGGGVGQQDALVDDLR